MGLIVWFSFFISTLQPENEEFIPSSILPIFKDVQQCFEHCLLTSHQQKSLGLSIFSLSLLRENAWQSIGSYLPEKMLDHIREAGLVSCG